VQHDLDGFVAAVTGASQGLGRAIALELGAHGAAGAITAQSVKAAGGMLT